VPLASTAWPASGRPRLLHRPSTRLRGRGPAEPVAEDHRCVLNLAAGPGVWDGCPVPAQCHQRHVLQAGVRADPERDLLPWVSLVTFSSRDTRAEAQTSLFFLFFFFWWYLIIQELISQEFLMLFIFHLSICSPQTRPHLRFKFILRSSNWKGRTKARRKATQAQTNFPDVVDSCVSPRRRILNILIMSSQYRAVAVQNATGPSLDSWPQRQ